MGDSWGRPRTHPVQAPSFIEVRFPRRAPVCVTLLAYEVCCEVFGPQEGLMTGDCGGGFSAGELVAFLYARAFPKGEWRERFDEALRGLNV